MTDNTQILEIIIHSGLGESMAGLIKLEIGQGETPDSIIERLDLQVDLVNSVIADGSFISFATPLHGVKKLVFLPHLGGG